jgi:hypothetical protein
MAKNIKEKCLPGRGGSDIQQFTRSFFKLRSPPHEFSGRNVDLIEMPRAPRILKKLQM